jgi:tRNA modification GTPase
MNSFYDTIVALATPPGSGGISIIRLSGKDAIKIGSKLHRGAPTAIRRPRELIYGDALANSRPVDQGLIVVMPAPRSYTGEDVVEIQLHGSQAAAALLIEAALEHGARPAEPGEFTKRAYLNGKLDLVQAEAVAELIAADTNSALVQAELKASGSISKQINSLKHQIVALIAKLSANLDFGEEDIPDINRAEIADEVINILAKVNSWVGSSKTALVIKDGLRVAIIGLPNAGKSSLLNALVGFDRAIVTDVAGTTRDTLEERIVINGLGVAFVDTAGLRVTSDEIESQGVARSQGASRQAHLILVAACADQDMDKLHQQIDGLKISGQKLIAVETKIDKASSSSQLDMDWPFSPAAIVRTSSKVGEGLEELRQAIYSLGVGSATPESAIITSARQIACLKSCALELSGALKAVESEAPMDIVAGELTLAAEQLSGLLGQSVNKAVIDQIFSNFCIGK